MKFSIITTCHNAQNVIEKTIKSVLALDFTDFEYIIQDGGSYDNTEAVCKAYADAFDEKNIPFYFYSEKDSGIYDGMNKGVKKAIGEYIIFMNADDRFFNKNVLTDVYNAVFDNKENSGDKKNSLPDIIYGDAVEYECGNYYKYKKDIGRIKTAMPFSHQSVFAKRKLLLKHPFDATLKIGADYDFLLSSYVSGLSFFDVSVTVCIVTRDGKSSRDLYNTFIETVKIQQKYGISNYTEKQYKNKLKSYKVKQLVMDTMPSFVIDKIRLIQRKSRGQDELVDI